MSPRPYVLAESTWKMVKDAGYQVVVLPWGATEAHNYHLPYATDNIQCDYIAAESARIAWENGAKVVVLNGHGGNDFRQILRDPNCFAETRYCADTGRMRLA